MTRNGREVQRSTGAVSAVKFRWTLLILVTLIVGMAWIWVNRVPAGGASSGVSLPPAPVIGHPAPDFALSTLDGADFRLSAQRGRPVVLNFWATWCPPCRAELPELKSANERYAGQVAVVGVNQAEPAATVAKFVPEFGLAFPIPLDQQGDVSRVYGVRSLPTTFFIDRDGIIRQIQNGPLTEATLAQLLGAIYP
jgi:cytochrome c biogenesis protein CcmG, thiol:disulfide interchange protein DsbE